MSLEAAHCPKQGNGANDARKVTPARRARPSPTRERLGLRAKTVREPKGRPPGSNSRPRRARHSPHLMHRTRLAPPWLPWVDPSLFSVDLFRCEQTHPWLTETRRARPSRNRESKTRPRRGIGPCSPNGRQNTLHRWPSQPTLDTFFGRTRDPALPLGINERARGQMADSRRQGESKIRNGLRFAAAPRANPKLTQTQTRA